MIFRVFYTNQEFEEVEASSKIEAQGKFMDEYNKLPVRIVPVTEDGRPAPPMGWYYPDQIDENDNTPRMW